MLICAGPSAPMLRRLSMESVETITIHGQGLGVVCVPLRLTLPMLFAESMAGLMRINVWLLV
jgi:hypothetical protein